MWVLSFLLTCIGVLIGCRSTPQVKWPFRAVTWNVNGTAKFHHQHPERDYLKSFDVIFLQETFSLDVASSFELDGFIPFHTPARSTGGGRQWGMTTLVKISSVVGGRLYSILTPCEWILACRWVRPSGLGVIFINSYIPAHSKSSGVTAQDIGHYKDFVRDLSISFPGDTFVCGGDFNVDRWRSANSRTYQPPLVR